VPQHACNNKDISVLIPRILKKITYKNINIYIDAEIPQNIGLVPHAVIHKYSQFLSCTSEF